MIAWTFLFLLWFQAPQTTHFERLPMPSAQGWITADKYPLKCEGDFVIPADGRYTLRYAQLTCEGDIKPPQDYSKKDTPVSPTLCDHFEEETHMSPRGIPYKVRTCPGGNQEPYYDVDESYDYITVQAKPATHWWYMITIAVPKKAP